MNPPRAARSDPPHNSFHHRCTFRKVLRVINELEDVLDRRFDRHSAVDLGRDVLELEAEVVVITDDPTEGFCGGQCDVHLALDDHLCP